MYLKLYIQFVPSNKDKNENINENRNENENENKNGNDNKNENGLFTKIFMQIYMCIWVTKTHTVYTKNTANFYRWAQEEKAFLPPERRKSANVLIEEVKFSTKIG